MVLYGLRVTDPGPVHGEDVDSYGSLGGPFRHTFHT